MGYQRTDQHLDPLDAPLSVGGPVMSPAQVRAMNAAMQKKKQEEAEKPKPKSGNWQYEYADRLNIGPGKQARVRVLFFEPSQHFVQIHYQWQVVNALCQKHLQLECPYCGKYFYENNGREALRTEYPVVMWVDNMTEVATGRIQPINRVAVVSYADNNCSPWSGIFNVMYQRLTLEDAPLHTYDILITQTDKGTQARFDVYPLPIDPRPFKLPQPWKMPTYRQILEVIDNRCKRLSSYQKSPDPQEEARPISQRSFSQGGREYVVEETEEPVGYSESDERYAPDDSVDYNQLFDEEPEAAPSPQPQKKSGPPRAAGKPAQWVPN